MNGILNHVIQPFSIRALQRACPQVGAVLDAALLRSVADAGTRQCCASGSRHALIRLPAAGHYHIPVYRRRRENIRGAIPVTSLLVRRGVGGGTELVGARPLRRPSVITPRTPLLDALKLFRTTRSQLAVVASDPTAVIGAHLAHMDVPAGVSVFGVCACGGSPACLVAVGATSTRPCSRAQILTFKDVVEELMQQQFVDSWRAADEAGPGTPPAARRHGGRRDAARQDAPGSPTHGADAVPGDAAALVTAAAAAAAAGAGELAAVPAGDLSALAGALQRLEGDPDAVRLRYGADAAVLGMLRALLGPAALPPAPPPSWHEGRTPGLAASAARSVDVGSVSASSLTGQSPRAPAQPAGDLRAPLLRSGTHSRYG